MKHIFNCIFITILGFLNIGNCFAGSADGNAAISDDSFVSFILFLINDVIVVIITLIVLRFLKWINSEDNIEEHENTRVCTCNPKQTVRNYINTEGKALIEEIIFKSFEKSETKKIIEHIVSEMVSEKKIVPSPPKTKTKEQSQFVSTQTVIQGYAERDSKDASMHSAPAQQQAVALEQAAMTETHSEVSNQFPVKYAREINNSFTLRDVSDIYQRGKSLYKLTIYKDKTARITLLLEPDEVKMRILNDNGNLLEPICEIIRNTNNPTDIRINQSGEAYFDGTNWIVDHNKKIKIELI